MKCPVCDVEMKHASIKNVEIDYCEQCQGFWCDKDELEKVAMLGKDYLASSPISKSIEEGIQSTNKPNKSLLLCPSCNASLVKFNYSYESDIFLETCKICNGIWVDDGELGDIIDYIYSE
ncbi:MAG: zf-TFIIB domain-containing protein [Deltaproteobacteria bacterium]